MWRRRTANGFRTAVVATFVFQIFGVAPLSGVKAADSQAAVEFFEQKVRPLLIQRCYSCHSAEKPVKGGLLLDSRPGWMAGGDSGAAIVPSKPDESRIIVAVRYQNSDLQMPPTGKLPDQEIAILEEWVRLGAPDPRTENVVAPKGKRDITSELAHWAYQPLRPVVLPDEAGDEAAGGAAPWATSRVDRFVASKRNEHHFPASLDADRVQFVRRVSLDLTGLPPTLDEVRRFAEDAEADAKDRLIDRLLGSPQFGERWARTWLDLVGYADQIGSANNVPADHAWRFRDYVIGSLDRDQPFDEFIREQIAGDLLEAESIEQRQRQLTATGFFVLGNVNIVEADKLVMRMDLVDLQIEKFGKAFLGMTLQCVRCHDHKFDPVTQRDYYGLAGILASSASTYKDDRGVWSSVTKLPLPETIDQFHERMRQMRSHERALDANRRERQQHETRAKELDPKIQELKDALAALGSADPNEAPTKAEDRKAKQTQLAQFEKERGEAIAKMNGLDQSVWHLNYLSPNPPVAFGIKDEFEIGDAKIQVRGNPYVLTDVVPRGFVKAVSHGESPAISPAESGRKQLAEWLTGSASSIVARVNTNRIWQKMFGRGIVASTDYFGLRGEIPTHPELLDDLASSLIADGWSRKRMVRRLALSRTYEQSSEPTGDPQKTLAADPDNRFLWRMSPRRLEAEMLRDTVLAVSDGLDLRRGGRALSPEFRENVGGLDPKDVNPISFSLNRFRDDQFRRRTVYLPVVRSSEQRGPSDVLNFFDFAQPAQMTSQRVTTSVASQSLFLLNGPLLAEAAKRIVTRVRSTSSLVDDSARIRETYWIVLNRSPAADEVEFARELIHRELTPAEGATAEASEESVARAWERLTHALLASNEFLFRL